MTPPRRRIWARLLVAVTIPLLVLLVLEGICRVAGVKPSQIQRPFRDFNLGWEFVTGDEPPFFERHPTRFFQPRRGVRGIARTDEHGFRGGDHPPRHPGMLRICVLGDSTTFGFGVRYGDTFVARLESALRDALPATDVDVVDAGCYAYSTYQNRVDLAQRVLPLEPDVVVLALSGYNDAGGAVGFSDEVWGAYSPRNLGPLGPILRESRLAAAIERFSSPISKRLLVGDPERAVEAVLEGGTPSGRRVPVEDFERNVRAMVEAARSAGAEVVLMIHRHPDQEIEQDAYRAGYPELLSRLAAELDLPLFDGGTRLPSADPNLYYDSIHPTEEGHRRLGAGLAELLLSHHEVRSRESARDGSRPEIDRIEPKRIYATGGEVVTLTGRDLYRDDEPPPRVFVAGEPAELVAAPDPTELRFAAPPAAPGVADVVIQTARGSRRWAETLLVEGPTLTVSDTGALAKVVIRGQPHDRYRLLVGTGRDERAIMLSRTYGLREGTLYPSPFEGTLPATGELELEIPLPPGPFSALHAQAFLEPSDGDYPRVVLPTDVATIERR